ncbi:MAG: helix-hairpin-helix domain-containing protein [Candidatus Symbiothrix sp.]|jgi:hypothetical protein|nr:helix-hairpin-helix domain-containing protein [Candidatus Symbiothrix sp.]
MKMLKNKILLLFIAVSCLNAGKVNGQNSEWMRYLEELANSEEADDEAIANLFDELSYLSDHPYDLQTVTKEELERLPFLTAMQIENLLYYIYRYGPLASIYELKNVEDLDRQTITYLIPFVYVGAGSTPALTPPTPPKTLKYAKQELLLRYDRTLQDKAGYASVPDEERVAHPNKYYLGDPYYLNFRYGISVGDKIQLGLSGEKDAGEPFPGKRGFDFYSFNLNFKHLGILEDLHFGNYRLGFGQGLVMNTNFSMGKTADAVNIVTKNGGIKRHTSTSESSYFSGVAGTLKFNNVRLNVFYSKRNQDANATDSTILTLKTDGYHRTFGDLQKRATARTELFGSSAQWRNKDFSLGVTAIYYNFDDKMLSPALHPYNVFALRGDDYWNVGVNYAFQQRKFQFQGETAVDKGGKIATVNHLTVSPTSFMDWAFSFRHYDRTYNALYGKSFGESTAVQNETGLYTGVKIQLPIRCELTAYYDYFSFPWLKYQVNVPSGGHEASVQLNYQAHEKLSMTLRYKHKEKVKDSSPYTQQNVRYQLNFNPNDRWHSKTQADLVFYGFEATHTNAHSITQSGSYIGSANFQIDGALGYFKTGDWNTRISIYEKNILYAFSFPTYYGEGLRYYMVAKWKIFPKLTVYLKCASTHYFDRSVISSGLEEIQGNEKTDFSAQIKYAF